MEVRPGTVAWAALAPTRGREQHGHRPVVVVAGAGYLAAVTSLTLIVPVTTVDRGWPNHVSLRGRTGLDFDSWAMTEQIRTISRGRITRLSGHVATDCLDEIRLWLGDFLELETPR